MIYDAHIKAGIDLSEAQVTVKDKEITVSFPEPEIQDITVDPDSLEFYDEKLALFNWTKKEDTQNAMKKAEEDAAEKAARTDLLSQAAEQARTVVTALLMPMAEDDEEYHIEVIQP